MKLDPDCIRELLLLVEEQSEFGREFVFPGSVDPPPEKTELDKLCYHMNQCIQSGLVDANEWTDGFIYIRDLTPKGHEFIADIRKDTTWNQVKAKMSKVGVGSLSAIVQITSALIPELIKENLF